MRATISLPQQFPQAVQTHLVMLRGRTNSNSPKNIIRINGTIDFEDH